MRCCQWNVHLGCWNGWSAGSKLQIDGDKMVTTGLGHEAAEGGSVAAKLAKEADIRAETIAERKSSF